MPFVLAGDVVTTTVNGSQSEITIFHTDINGVQRKVIISLEMQWSKHNGAVEVAETTRGKGGFHYTTALSKEVVYIRDQEVPSLESLGVVGRMGFSRVTANDKGVPQVVCKAPRMWNVAFDLKLHAVSTFDCVADGETRTLVFEYFANDREREGIENGVVVEIKGYTPPGEVNQRALMLEGEETSIGYHIHYAAGDMVDGVFKTHATEHVCSVVLEHLNEGETLNLDTRCGDNIRPLSPEELEF